MKDDLSGVYSSVLAAVNGARQPEYKFYLDGDLRQMSTQGDFLREQGFDVGRNDVYPCLRTEDDYKRALTLFWQRRTEGWWNYRTKLFEYGICTEAEFTAALDRECEKSR